MSCRCQVCGCSNPRDCDEEYCTEHLIEELEKEKDATTNRGSMGTRKETVPDIN